MRKFTISTKKIESGDTGVIEATGHISSRNAMKLDSEIETMVSEGIRTIVVDLSAVDFIGSSGIGVLIGTATILRQEGGDLVLMGVPRLIIDILTVLNVLGHFRVVKTLSEVETAAKTT